MLPLTPLPLPDPDQIRQAIDKADERAKLLRRLLRLSLRLRLHLADLGSRVIETKQTNGGDK